MAVRLFDVSSAEGADATITDQELSRLIAEKLEPNPEFDNEIGETLWQYWLRSPITARSKGGLWFLDRIEDGVGPKPISVDDPAMTVMLIGLPGFMSLCQMDSPAHESCRYHAAFCGAAEHTKDCGTHIEMAYADSTGRAVAEAAAKAWAVVDALDIPVTDSARLPVFWLKHPALRHAVATGHGCKVIRVEIRAVPAKPKRRKV